MRSFWGVLTVARAKDTGEMKKQIAFFLTEDEIGYLKTMAMTWGCTASQMIAHLINQAFESKQYLKGFDLLTQEERAELIQLRQVRSFVTAMREKAAFKRNQDRRNGLDRGITNVMVIAAPKSVLKKAVLPQDEADSHLPLRIRRRLRREALTGRIDPQLHEGIDVPGVYCKNLGNVWVVPYGTLYRVSVLEIIKYPCYASVFDYFAGRQIPKDKLSNFVQDKRDFIMSSLGEKAVQRRLYEVYGKIQFPVKESSALVRRQRKYGINTGFTDPFAQQGQDDQGLSSELMSTLDQIRTSASRAADTCFPDEQLDDVVAVADEAAASADASAAASGATASVAADSGSAPTADDSSSGSEGTAAPARHDPYMTSASDIASLLGKFKQMREQYAGTDAAYAAQLEAEQSPEEKAEELARQLEEEAAHDKRQFFFNPFGIDGIRRDKKYRLDPDDKSSDSTGHKGNTPEGSSNNGAPGSDSFAGFDLSTLTSADLEPDINISSEDNVAGIEQPDLEIQQWLHEFQQQRYNSDTHSDTSQPDALAPAQQPTAEPHLETATADAEVTAATDTDTSAQYGAAAISPAPESHGATAASLSSLAAALSAVDAAAHSSKQLSSTANTAKSSTAQANSPVLNLEEQPHHEPSAAALAALAAELSAVETSHPAVQTPAPASAPAPTQTEVKPEAGLKTETTPAEPVINTDAPDTAEAKVEPTAEPVPAPSSDIAPAQMVVSVQNTVPDTADTADAAVTPAVVPAEDAVPASLPLEMKNPLSSDSSTKGNVRIEVEEKVSEPDTAADTSDLADLAATEVKISSGKTAGAQVTLSLETDSTFFHGLYTPAAPETKTTIAPENTTVKTEDGLKLKETAVTAEKTSSVENAEAGAEVVSAQVKSEQESADIINPELSVTSDTVIGDESGSLLSSASDSSLMLDSTSDQNSELNLTTAPAVTTLDVAPAVTSTAAAPASDNRAQAEAALEAAHFSVPVTKTTVSAAVETAEQETLAISPAVSAAPVAPVSVSPVPSQDPTTEESAVVSQSASSPALESAQSAQYAPSDLSAQSVPTAQTVQPAQVSLSQEKQEPAGVTSPENTQAEVPVKAHTQNEEQDSTVLTHELSVTSDTVIGDESGSLLSTASNSSLMLDSTSDQSSGLNLTTAPAVTTLDVAPVTSTAAASDSSDAEVLAQTSAPVIAPASVALDAVSVAPVAPDVAAANSDSLAEAALEIGSANSSAPVTKAEVSSFKTETEVSIPKTEQTLEIKPATSGLSVTEAEVSSAKTKAEEVLEVKAANSSAPVTKTEVPSSKTENEVPAPKTETTLDIEPATSSVFVTEAGVVSSKTETEVPAPKTEVKADIETKTEPEPETETENKTTSAASASVSEGLLALDNQTEATLEIKPAVSQVPVSEVSAPKIEAKVEIATQTKIETKTEAKTTVTTAVTPTSVTATETVETEPPVVSTLQTAPAAETVAEELIITAAAPVSATSSADAGVAAITADTAPIFTAVSAVATEDKHDVAPVAQEVSSGHAVWSQETGLELDSAVDPKSSSMLAGLTADSEIKLTAAADTDSNESMELKSSVQSEKESLTVDAAAAATAEVKVEAAVQAETEAELKIKAGAKTPVTENVGGTRGRADNEVESSGKVENTRPAQSPDALAVVPAAKTPDTAAVDAVGTARAMGDANEAGAVGDLAQTAGSGAADTEAEAALTRELINTDAAVIGDESGALLSTAGTLGEIGSHYGNDIDHGLEIISASNPQGAPDITSATTHVENMALDDNAAGESGTGSIKLESADISLSALNVESAAGVLADSDVSGNAATATAAAPDDKAEHNKTEYRTVDAVVTENKTKYRTKAKNSGKDTNKSSDSGTGLGAGAGAGAGSSSGTRHKKKKATTEAGALLDNVPLLAGLEDADLLEIEPAVKLSEAAADIAVRNQATEAGAEEGAGAASAESKSEGAGKLEVAPADHADTDALASGASIKVTPAGEQTAKTSAVLTADEAPGITLTPVVSSASDPVSEQVAVSGDDAVSALSGDMDDHKEENGSNLLMSDNVMGADTESLLTTAKVGALDISSSLGAGDKNEDADTVLDIAPASHSGDSSK